MAHAEISVGHVRGYLLVAGRNQFDLLTRAIKRVEQPHVAVSANSEHIGDLLFDKVLGDDFGALHSRHGSHPLPWFASLIRYGSGGSPRMLVNPASPQSAMGHWPLEP